MLKFFKRLFAKINRIIYLGVLSCTVGVNYKKFLKALSQKVEKKVCQLKNLDKFEQSIAQIEKQQHDNRRF
jgi:hypothetical protein